VSAVTTTSQAPTEPTSRVDYETLYTEVSDDVAVLTINRPEVRNAVNRQVQLDIRAALDALRTDDDVQVVIVTGAGEKAFVAGADIAQVRTYTLHTALSSDLQRLYDDVEAFEKPTIAAVNGFALGGGCELAMSCDIRIAADTARFGLPETNLSVLPAAGGTQRLARLVGTGRAIEMILTGRLVKADEAQRIGLVTAVVPGGELLTTAREVAGQITAKGPLAIRLAKLVIRTGMDADQRTGLVVERLAQALLYTTDDKTEGTEAFLAKRPPVFTGR
jgi:enoyl-CoA hydratase/carnithine racemase